MRLDLDISLSVSSVANWIINSPFNFLPASFFSETCQINLRNIPSRYSCWLGPEAEVHYVRSHQARLIIAFFNSYLCCWSPKCSCESMRAAGILREDLFLRRALGCSPSYAARPGPLIINKDLGTVRISYAEFLLLLLVCVMGSKSRLAFSYRVLRHERKLSNGIWGYGLPLEYVGGYSFNGVAHLNLWQGEL